jgi:hypothetical protein
MRETGSAWLIGTIMTLLGLLGLFLAAGAGDDEMYVFGFSLAGFACMFVIGLVRRHHVSRRNSVIGGRPHG